MGVVVSHGAPGPWSAPLVLPSSTGARVNAASSKTLVALAPRKLRLLVHAGRVFF